MKTVATLIDLAREQVGTDRALAARLEIPEQNVNAMKKGRRALSPEMAIAICDIAGISGTEAMEWVAIALTENPKNAERLPLLKRVLFGKSMVPTPEEGTEGLTAYTS